MTNTKILSSLIIAVYFLNGLPTHASFNKESNVVYGMYSGLALLMDVYTPENSNGYGIIFINGSGWHAGLELNTRALKDRPDTLESMGIPLIEEGFTLFFINHRSAPRFKMPDIIADAQRAVRFVRHHAERYQIDPGKLTAMGGSSGAHLSAMLGVMDGKGDPVASDEILRHSAKVQCVVAHAAPADLAADGTPMFFVTSVTATIGVRMPRSESEKEVYQEVSPLYHVTPDDAPMLLIHGDQDGTVPFAQSELFTAKLKETGVSVTFVPVKGGGHGLTGNINNAKAGKLPHPKAVADWILKQLH
jgi:acetyl esterase/lipase